MCDEEKKKIDHVLTEAVLSPTPLTLTLLTGFFPTCHSFAPQLAT